MIEKKKTTTKSVHKEEKKVAPKKEVVKKATVKKATPAKVQPKKEEARSDDASKQIIIDTFSTHTGDTGSPEVQVAILTWKIGNLQKHLGINQKDNHSRRGLLKIVSKRRRIMKYLHDKDEDRFQVLETKIKEYQATNKKA